MPDLSYFQIFSESPSSPEFPFPVRMLHFKSPSAMWLASQTKHRIVEARNFDQRGIHGVGYGENDQLLPAPLTLGMARTRSAVGPGSALSLADETRLQAAYKTGNQLPRA